MTRPAMLFVGVGSAQGDDQIALRIADRLGSRPWAVVKHATSPIRLLDWLDGFERLVVCDACHAETTPGTLLRWRWPHNDLAKTHFAGTHDLALGDVLALAQQAGLLPATVEVLGVAIQWRPHSGELSPQLAVALPGLVEQIEEIIAHA